ncbi:MAG: exodeoxyribonuclease I [Wenzhouxiangella sp.]
MTQPSFLWHDFETFGADPRRDRPSQFAALRSDESLDIIDEPTVIYCQPPLDRLPHPDACLITGISPQLAAERGLPEHEFAERIHQLMSEPATCSVGFNNFRFDDEVSRHLFWRNFFDPYAREYANGNSRFDLIDLLRMTRALRPEGLNWPDRDDGQPSFRLEDLARANGLDTRHAHDALADVNNTLAMARLLARHQPKLWHWALSLRDRETVNRLLLRQEPLVHSSARLPAMHCATSLVLPFAPHPRFKGQWLVWDLRHDPTPFAALDVDTLADCLWTPAADLPEEFQRLPVKTLRANRCPMIAPTSVMDSQSRQRIQLDPDQVDQNRRRLEADHDLLARLLAVFSADNPMPGGLDAESDLYGGFVPRDDQRLFAEARSAHGERLAAMRRPFSDERLNDLLLAYRARRWPDSLSADEQREWQERRQARLLHDPDLASIQWPAYQARLAQLKQERPDALDLVVELESWATHLGLNNESGT